MDQYIHQENLALFRKKLAETKDDAQLKVLLKLLAEEEAKDERKPERLKWERGRRPALAVRVDLALDQCRAAFGRHIFAMAHFVFKCPATGLDVQRELDDDPDISENEYEAVRCLACAGLHLVNRKNGKVLGQHEGVRPPPGRAGG